jgi:hypothetical protein
MDEYELTQWRDNYKHDSYYYRGKLLDTFNALEKMIENYLVDYFWPGNQFKANQLQGIILDRLTFEAKRTSLRAILERRATDNGFVKTKNNSYPDSKFLDEIRLLNDERNYFAHYYLLTPSAPDGTIICLAEFRDQGRYIDYTEDQYNSIIYRMSDALIKILEMKKSI